MHNTSSEKNYSPKQGRTRRYFADIGGTGNIQYRIGATHNEGTNRGPDRQVSIELCPLDLLGETKRTEDKIAIIEALNSLGNSIKAKRAQFILVAYYWHDMTMQEIGDGLGLSRERISQIIKQTLKKLRKMLGE